MRCTLALMFAVGLAACGSASTRTLGSTTTTSSGASASTTSTVPSVRWSGLQRIDGSNGISAISCTTQSFCMAGDNEGNVITYENGAWSTPQNIDRVRLPYGRSLAPPPYFVWQWTVMRMRWYSATDHGLGLTISTRDIDQLYSVSCPTSTFCITVDGNGNEFTYSNNSWSAANNVDFVNAPNSIDCFSATFCVIVDNGGNAVVYSGGSWATPSGIDTSSKLESVSCLTAESCIAVDANGNALTYSDGSWSAPDAVDTQTYPDTPNYGLTSISCPTSTFCLAGDGNGDVYAYHNGSWSAHNALIANEGVWVRVRTRRSVAPSVAPRNTDMPPFITRRLVKGRHRSGSDEEVRSCGAQRGGDGSIQRGNDLLHPIHQLRPCVSGRPVDCQNAVIGLHTERGDIRTLIRKSIRRSSYCAAAMLIVAGVDGGISLSPPLSAPTTWYCPARTCSAEQSPSVMPQELVWLQKYS